MSGKIIGYTTGVFDLFHIGHLRVLQRARANCDYLIVGVTTDDLVMQRKLKRPMIGYADRIEIVKALRCVDEVVPQADMDKLSAFFRLGFHRMFVGSDWRGTPAWVEYERELAPYGAKIIYLPHTDGISSTIIAEQIREIESEAGGKA